MSCVRCYPRHALDLLQCRLILMAMLYVLLLTFSVSAKYRFDSWTTDNGLPQGSINSIHQTKDGFLWFTTFGGLVRYDGLRFTVFNSGNTKGIKSGRFTQMNEDREGNLWITTEAQGITRYKDGIFTTFSTENGLTTNQIKRIDNIPGGIFLVDTRDSILQWNGSGFSNYSPANGEPTKNILQRKEDGAIWYLEDSHLRKSENGKVTVDFAPDFTVYRMFEDSNRRVWMATDRDELFMLRDGKLSAYTEKDGFPKGRFIKAIEDKDGRILFATRAGFIIFENDKFTRFNVADGLVADSVQDVYQDREGTIWVGTQTGLSRLTKAGITSFSAADGLADDNVYSIFQDKRGKIWIGSWTGLTIYENGTFQNVSEKFGLLNDDVTAIYEDREDNLWIATWSGKILRVSNGQITHLQQNEQLGGHIRAIYQDRAGKIWFGTNKGLVKFENGKFTVQNGISGKSVYAIHEDKSGQFWFGSDGGLIKFKDGIFTQQDGVSTNTVRTIYEDKDGTLWIGMYDSGLYRYQNGQFTHYTTNEGLFDNGIFQIIEDQSGNFWISCNLGVYRVKKSELNDLAEKRLSKITSVPYNKRDGMLNSECNGGSQPAGMMAQDGRIWFPTQKGVAIITPNLIPYNNLPPPVVIESVIVDNKPINFYVPIEMQPEQTNLEINYSGLSFINPELVKFKYKLEGLDTDWTDAASRRTAYYAHLPPGKYRFLVTAANRDGIWNEQGTLLEIEVFPPFWRTVWFLTLIVFAVALIAFLFYRWRTGTLKKAKATQEAFSLQLIESQEEERKRIAIELHDSLGQSLVLIRNWALLGLKKVDEQNAGETNLNKIAETASVSINEVREIAYDLGPYQLDRLGLKSSIEEMVHKFISSSPIKFGIDIDEIDDCFDKKMQIGIFRILQEACNNIVKHSKATHANLLIKKSVNNLTLTISDNGRGFDYENFKKNGKRGLGLFGMNERVNLLKGEFLLKSESEKGTIIVINLPTKGLKNER